MSLRQLAKEEIVRPLLFLRAKIAKASSPRGHLANTLSFYLFRIIIRRLVGILSLLILRVSISFSMHRISNLTCPYELHNRRKVFRAVVMFRWQSSFCCFDVEYILNRLMQLWKEQKSNWPWELRYLSHTVKMHVRNWLCSIMFQEIKGLPDLKECLSCNFILQLKTT